MLLAFPFFAAFGYTRAGLVGVEAAAVAGGICWLGAAPSLFLMGWLRGGPHVVSGVLLGMLIRMGLPLAIGLLLAQTGGPLAKAGVFGMIVGYYLVGLLIETLLSVRLIGASAPDAARAS
jgi:hypothetical protein